MDATAVNTWLKAAPALEMLHRVPEILENHLRYHRIEDSTDATG